MAEIRTAAEASGWERHTSHEEMMDYLEALQSAGGELQVESYGESHEGRELVLVRLGASTPESPEEAHDRGHPILLLGANAHGFNYTLRESLLLLVREMATPGTELNRRLDRMVVLVAPSKNPDGLQAESRFNAAGADLNRDYMTLDQPETAAYVGSVVNRWRPHLLVDGHDGGAVQYGGAEPYALLYQAPATAAADPALTELADREIFPRISERFEGEGLEAFYWARGEPDAWYGGGSAPRMGRNYGGLADILSILFEVAAWPEWHDSVDAGVLALTTILDFAHEDGDRLLDQVLETRRRTLALGGRADAPIPVEEEMVAEADPVRYRIPHPDRPGDFLEVTEGELVKRPEGTRFRERPLAYLLPSEATEAVDLLQRHGIQVQRLTESMELEVRGYRLAGLGEEEGRDESESVTRVEIGEVVDEVRTIEAGSWLVRTDQPLGRVITHLLEAETTESVIYWGRMAPLLPGEALRRHLDDPETHPAPLVPILKVMTEFDAPLER